MSKIHPPKEGTLHTTYDLCKWIRKSILTHAAEVIAYSWDAEFSRENLKSLPEKLKKAKGFRLIDPSDLTAEEMKDLGFGRWSDDNPINLIPLWLKPFLAERIKAGSISGEEPAEIETATMDDDHRFGCLAYGVLPRA